MTNKHNQTQSEWLSVPNALGTGIFMIPDVWNPEPRAVYKVLIPDITYEDAVVRAELCPVFKWVPHHIASYESLVSDAEQCQIGVKVGISSRGVGESGPYECGNKGYEKDGIEMDNLEIACEKLREYLENWYMDRVEEYFSTDEGRGILPEELTIARQSFFQEYPAYAPFEFDIYTTFDTGASICGGGCCSPLSPDGKEHKIVRGVKVGLVDWEKLAELGIKEVKI